MLVADLKNLEIEYWVARAEGFKHVGIVEDQVVVSSSAPLDELEPRRMHNFIKNWAEAGRIIRQHHISIQWCYASNVWMADCPHYVDGKFVGRVQQWSKNDDPLEAAMRCYVASIFGSEVPDEETYYQG